jgi:predicted nucleic acid-binding protein
VIVVDASVLLEVLLRTSRSDRLTERLLAHDEALHAPHLIDLEVAQVLRRANAAGDISQDRAREALDDLAAFRLTRHAHLLFLDRIWKLRHNLTAYDAAYLALAETLDAPLLTCDRALARSPGHTARVELIEG